MLWIVYKVARQQPIVINLVNEIGMTLSIIATLMFLSHLPGFFGV